MRRASHPRRSGPRPLAALAALLVVTGAAAGVGAAHPVARRAEPVAPPPAAARADSADGDQTVPPSGVRDPLLELLWNIAADDSLGSWDGAALARRVAASGRTSRLPVGDIARITRRPATAAEAERRRGATVTRVWELELKQALHVPLPYAFLGYHPGTLAAARTFVLSEWPLADQTVHVAVDGRLAALDVTAIHVMRLDSGWFTLDVDAWLDALLGGLLDDYWTCGFVFARHAGRPLEVSLLVNRDGGDDYGQFDLGHDRIVAHPEPVARGLSLLARPWVAPPPGSARVPWRVETAGGGGP